MKIIDITKGLLKAPLYPGNPVPEITLLADMKNGDDYMSSLLSCCVHTSTHADSFAHFVDSQITIDKMPLEHYLGTAFVVKFEPGEIPDETLLRKIPAGCKRLIVKGNGEAYFGNNSGNILREKGVMTVCTDYWSVSPLDNEKTVHVCFLKNNIAIIEAVDLTEVEEGSYFLSAPPLKIEDCDGAPLRAILIDME